MTRLEPRAPRRLDLFRRFTFFTGRRMFKLDPEPSRVIAHSKPALFGYGMVGMAVERGVLSHRLKHLAMLRTAQLTGCEWCLDFGSSRAEESGIPEADLRELSLWRRSERFDAVDRLVLEYAEAMTRTPVAVSDEQFAALREHLDEEQLVELTYAIAAENFFCRTNWALGIEGQGFAEGMYCVVPDPDGARLLAAGEAPSAVSAAAV